MYADIFLSTRVSLSTNTADDADDSGAADRVCDELDLSCALTAAITVALERLTTVYDLSSMALASLSYRRSDDERLSWPSDSWQGGNLLAFEKRNYAGSGAAVRPTLELRSSLPGVSLPLVLVTLLGCLLPQFFVQRFLKNRLFVGDLGKIPSTVEPAIPDDRIQRHLFLLAGEGPWKTDLIRRPDIECVDLACAPWIDLDTDWQRVRNWREDTEGPVIFLDHFDVHSDDVDATREKIRLLEHLIGMCNRTVLLATARAPENFSLSRTDGGEPHRELRARWLALLRQFQRVYPDAERREDEGEPTYYERLWSVSTRSERAVMVRLWQTGLVNLKRRWVTRRLLDRGILQTKPALRFRDEGFAKFAFAPDHLKQAERWEAEGAAGRKWRLWRTVPVAFAVGLAGFLLLTQEQLRSSIGSFDNLERWIASAVAAISVALPTLKRLATFFIPTRE